MTTRLQQVFNQHGQSPWLDNLQRSYLTDGSLQTLVDEGVRGLTSNPTIFQKAIQGSSDYDEQFIGLIKSGVSPIDAYWELVISDINGALDIFETLHQTSGGTDGFVSVEVDPSLSRNGDETLIAARKLHERISRPNVMIKIPATREGLPAIQQMIAEGRSVNVTLIFSLHRYAQVMEAYISGLEQRLDAGLDVSGVHSVASFFISRVDNVIDGHLDAIATSEALDLKGAAAIAQAQLAYELFLAAFNGPRWQRLVDAGAHVQRPLWASTSTKNPSYPDTLYVDRLIGPFTVNTLPDATLRAFSDHGHVSQTIDINVSVAHDVWSKIQLLGINVDEIAEQLESDGVASFISSFNELIAALRDKASSIS